MKTAVSLPDPLFDRAEQTARSLGLTRSALYARALERFLGEAGPPATDEVTAALDRIYSSRLRDDSGAVAGRALIDSGAWEW